LSSSGSRHCKWAAFQETLALAADAGRRNKRACHDRIKPTWACPGFGYIEHGKPIRLRKRPDNEAIHRVVRFVKNQILIWRNHFCAEEIFRWNAGMFVWSVPTVLREISNSAQLLK